MWSENAAKVIEYTFFFKNLPGCGLKPSSHKVVGALCAKSNFQISHWHKSFPILECFLHYTFLKWRAAGFKSQKNSNDRPAPIWIIPGIKTRSRFGLPELHDSCLGKHAFIQPWNAEETIVKDFQQEKISCWFWSIYINNTKTYYGSFFSYSSVTRNSKGMFCFKQQNKLDKGNENKIAKLHLKLKKKPHKY